MKLTKLFGVDLKKLLSNEIKISKQNKINLKKGEILEGKILEQNERFLLVNIGKDTIIKANSTINFNLLNKNVLFKVVETSPSIILKILNKNYEIAKDIQEKDIAQILKNFPDLEKEIKFSNNDFKHIKNLKEKIKQLPEKLGLNFEKNILNKKKVLLDNLKAKLLDSLNSFPNKHEIEHSLKYIENIQKLNNDFFLFLPIFFENRDIEKGAIFYKKLKKNKNSNIGSFNIAIILELSNNRKLQINVIIFEKNISLTFLSNNQNFLNLLKNNFKLLEKNFENSKFKIISVNFKVIDKIDFSENFEEFGKIEKNSNIVDFKT